LESFDLTSRLFLQKKIKREYMARYNLYKERAWSCTVSGKTLLTYEEALLSEKKAAALLEAFPVVYQRAIFPLVHHSKSHSLFHHSYSSMSFGSPLWLLQAQLSSRPWPLKLLSTFVSPTSRVKWWTPRSMESGETLRPSFLLVLVSSPRLLSCFLLSDLCFLLLSPFLVSSSSGGIFRSTPFP